MRSTSSMTRRKSAALSNSTWYPSPLRSGLCRNLLAIGAIVVVPLVLSFVGLGGISETLLRVLRWPALLLVVMLGLAALYRFGPSRDEARWQWLSVGSVFAAITWLASSALLSWYLENFADYDATYGSLGAAIGLMMWMWALRHCDSVWRRAEFRNRASDCARQHRGSGKAAGRTGAAMADTVGAIAK